MVTVIRLEHLCDIAFSYLWVFVNKKNKKLCIVCNVKFNPVYGQAIGSSFRYADFYRKVLEKYGSVMCPERTEMVYTIDH